MCLFVETRDETIVRACVNHVGVRWVGNDKASFATANVVPVRAVDSALIAAAGDGDRGIVLLSAVDVVRKGVVYSDVVELRGLLVGLSGPRLAVVVRNGGAAVVGIDHPFWMRRIDPEAVIISVRRANKIEGVAAVGRTVDGGVQYVDGVDVSGIGENVMEIPGALCEAVIGIQELPGVAGVVAAEDAAFFGFDDGVDAIPVGSGNRDADATENAGGKAVTFEALPSGTIVAGFIETAARASADCCPGIALRLVESSEQDVRIGRNESEVDGSGLVVLEENFLPRFAAVGGTEDSARFVGAVSVTHRRDEEDVGICRMDDDPGDVSRILEADVRPGLAAIN